MTRIFQPITRLTGDRKALLEALLREQGLDTSGAGRITRREDPTVYPLSFAQVRLWFLAQLDPDSPLYNEPLLAVRLKGPLDASALEQSLTEILRRHEVLRAAFTTVDGQPTQRIVPVSAMPLPVLDLRDRSRVEREAELDRLLQAESRRPFDMETGALLRGCLVRLDDQEHVLLLARHHSVSDGWSTGILIRELGVLYEAFAEGRPSPLAELPIQYSDFAAWQHQWLQGEVLDKHLAYWKAQLGGGVPALNLPTDRPRPNMQRYRGATEPFSLPAQLVEQLQALSRQEGVTLFVTILAAFQTMLHRYSGQEDLLVGSPVANRTRTETQELMGMFINTLVLRSDLSGNPTFRELLSRLRRVTLDAFEHQDLPFQKLVEAVQPERDMSRSPLFQVMFVLHNAHMEAVELMGLRLHPQQIHNGCAKFDLTLELTENPDGIAGLMEYNADLFEAATIRRMISHFQELLRAAVAQPNEQIGSLPMLTEAERELLLTGFNDTAVPLDGALCIHELFDARASATPDAPAVAFEDRQISFAELNRQSNQLAHYLRRLGVGPDVVVGISIDRSIAMIVGLLGILKAGGAYLPLDPAYPEQRLGLMLADARVPVILSQQRLAPKLTATDARVVCLDVDWPAIAAESSDLPVTEVGPENLAYVIYTSGSTGKPKGVMIHHRSVCNFFTGMDQRIGCSPGDALAAVTSISFDISVLEIFWTLTRGAQVVLLSEQAVREAAAPPLSAASAKEMAFSLFYFANSGPGAEADNYQLLLEGAQFADRHGFEAVWVPERHFHEFGGLYPNPSVFGAALAMLTDRIKIRAGSVVLPLHSPIRVAEEWSVVDNLSGGRVGLAFASGWHADDFVLAPRNYANRKPIMFESIETVQRLWRGESVQVRGGAGNELAVEVYPKPIQPQLPIWITTAGSPDTFRKAAEIGAHVLTHLLDQNIDDVAANIALYRETLARCGYDPASHRVTLMVHTFVDDTLEAAREKVRAPFRQYLRSSVALIANLARSLGITDDVKSLPEADMEDLLDFAFDRYFGTSALFGTPETCLAMVEQLKQIGVDEIACLIDFGVEQSAVLESLKHLNELRERCAMTDEGDYSLAAQVQRYGVTHLQCTPSFMQMLTLFPESLEGLKPLQKVMLGGEPLPASLLHKLRESLPACLFNMYGPTETTIWSSTWAVDPTSPAILVGRPIANTRMYVLDKHAQPAPMGVSGELYIGGAGVARGYLRSPELSDQRFVADSFCGQPGRRMYRTGDLACVLPDGAIALQGRVDDQVKVRGYRIELGDIESALARYPGVHEVVVMARSYEAGNKRLVAYIVPSGEKPSAAELRAFLGKELPEYMIHPAFVVLESLPRTPNGKVNRLALPAPDKGADVADAAYLAPRNPLEEQLVAIWERVLGGVRVGVRDNFFDVGGHSLMATQLIAEIRKSFALDLSLRSFFQAPTVEALAQAIVEEQVSQEDPQVLAQLLQQLGEMSDGEADLLLAGENGQSEA